MMRKRAATLLATGLPALLLGVSPPTPAQSPEETKIVAVVQAFLTAMAQRDENTARQVTLPTGRFTSVREIEGKRVIRSFGMQDDIAGWANRPEDVLERIWNPDVRVFDHLATVTAPYDFHRNGKFSHCGTDVFELLETEDGWRVSGGAYNVRLTGCPASPLGPPSFETSTAVK